MKFTFKFTTPSLLSEIKQITFEFPMLDPYTGQTVYNPANAFFALPNDAQYPCYLSALTGITANNNNFGCYIENGSTNDLGRPTRIHVKEITVNSANNGQISMLIRNPVEG
jgi:hypothetical protein